MPKETKKYSWKFYLVCLLVLVLEFFLVWEAKLVTYYRQKANWRDSQVEQTALNYSQQAQEAETKLIDFYTERLSSLLSIPDEDFGPLVGCGSVWLDYETIDGLIFKYPKGMRVNQTHCIREDCCGPVGFELTFFGRDDFGLEFRFSTEDQLPACQGEKCVAVRDYLTNFPEISLMNLSGDWTQTTTDQLNSLWGDKFEVLVKIDSGNECRPYLRSNYNNWSQRMVVLRVAQSLQTGESGQ